MKLFVCWGTFPNPLRPGGHPCRNAYVALTEAGHDPEVEKVYGLGPIPEAFNGPRRREIKQLTGQSWVPVLVLDDGEIVQGSKEIAAWAGANAAPAASSPS